MQFAAMRVQHPTKGNSFHDMCVPGIIDAIDGFAKRGEGLSKVLVTMRFSLDGEGSTALRSRSIQNAC